MVGSFLKTSPAYPFRRPVRKSLDARSMYSPKTHTTQHLFLADTLLPARSLKSKSGQVRNSQSGIFWRYRKATVLGGWFLHRCKAGLFCMSPPLSFRVPTWIESRFHVNSPGSTSNHFRLPLETRHNHSTLVMCERIVSLFFPGSIGYDRVPAIRSRRMSAGRLQEEVAWLQIESICRCVSWHRRSAVRGDALKLPRRW